MKIEIKTININLDESVSLYIKKKILPLEKFIKDFLPQEKDLKNPIEERKERVIFFIDAGREPNKSLFFSKARVSLPRGKTIIAFSEAGNLREAIDILRDDLHAQLSSIKKKKIAITERKVRAAKKDTNLSEGARFYRKGRIREEGL